MNDNNGQQQKPQMNAHGRRYERRTAAIGYQLSVTAKCLSVLCALCVLCGVVGWGAFITNCETNPISPTGLRDKDLGLEFGGTMQPIV